MEKGKTLKSINRSYHGHMKSLTRAGRERDILAALSNGKNTYMRMDRVESSSYDSSWIDEIENVIFDLGTIIANPKQVTKAEGNIVPVELARKINAESVQHLASHTQYVKEIDEYGNVIPSKILTLINEDDIRTYENRFIATFVRRLVLFIEKRYEFVSKFAELHDESVLMFKNKSIVDGAEVEIETKIRINHKSDDEISLKNNEYVERIKQMRQYILYFYTSDFMKKLKTEKDVHNPILQTNIIRKNPLYHHCYEVYKFIERYEHLGVHYKVDEQYSVFNDQELAEINHTLFANYITLKGKERSATSKGSTKVYKPKIKTSPDDDAFIYGPLYEGPIEFLRTDKPYQDYLDSKVRKDLPIHPTKREKEYYADEYAAKAENKEDLKQKNDLIRRKEKEVAAFNKAAAKIDAEREAARLALLEQEKQIIKKEEDDLLAAARNEIISASLEDQSKAELQRLQDEIASVNVIEATHPHSDPVTYEEAVSEIWPQADNAPLLRVKPEGEEDEPVYTPEQVSEAPVVEEDKEQSEPVVVEVSHPYSEPVTFDEAVLQIWPQVANAPLLREESKEEQPVEQKVQKPAPKAKKAKEQPVVESQPVAEEKKEQPVTEQVKPVEPTHPYSDPVTYDEAVLQIWPQLANKPKPAKKKAPSKKAEPVKEQPVKVQPKVEEKPKAAPKAKKAPVVEPKPADVPECQHPYSEPVTYDEAALEIWPQIANAPALRVADEDEEAPVVDLYVEPENKPEPVKEKPVKEKKAPKKKEQVKQAPKQEPKVEQPKEVKKEAPKAKKAPAKKAAPAPKAKPAPKKEKAPAIPVRVVEKPREKIPGRFIVKLMEGYYVNDKKVSPYKEDAKVFEDFNLAKDIKKVRGGKVVKL